MHRDAVGERVDAWRALCAWLGGIRRAACLGIVAVASAVVLSACGDSTFMLNGLPERNEPLVRATCNGRADLCARRLDQVVMLMTHNAMSSVEAKFKSPNQTHDLTHQLNAGVRGLMLDMHMVQGRAYLCHAKCKRGRTLLVDGFREIDAFMHTTPDAVIVVIAEDYIPVGVLRAALDDTHLDAHLADAPAAGAPWPTLGEMVAQDRRLVLFAEHTQDGPAWYPHAWQHVRDTPFKAFRTRDFTCVRNRGPDQGTFFLVNHWLSPQHPLRARTANRRDVLQAHVQGCAASVGRLPNFIGVDFYEIGDVWDVVGWADEAWRAGL